MIGFVQFIESISVAEVLANEGSILTYFRKLAPSENTPHGILPEVMDNYIKSCGTGLSFLVFFFILVNVMIWRFIKIRLYMGVLQLTAVETAWRITLEIWNCGDISWGERKRVECYVVLFS